ncbi:MAG TPA: DUF2795 domain-containing protein [Actinomycetota bacterium]|jgi:hypothetical protein|nr:DUF2795 domain-containing protein [Actinomycetota bacterium]
MESSLDRDEAEQRSRIAISVKQTIFPADKKTLVADAEQNYADDWVISRLKQLPEETSFENVQQVWEALGGSEEHRY